MDHVRRKMLVGSAAAAALVGASQVSAADETSNNDAGVLARGTRVVSGGCVLTINARGFSASDISSREIAEELLKRFLPVMAQNMYEAANESPTRGCSVSASATASSGGGVSGSATVSCTF